MYKLIRALNSNEGFGKICFLDERLRKNLFSILPEFTCKTLKNSSFVFPCVFFCLLFDN